MALGSRFDRLAVRLQQTSPHRPLVTSPLPQGSASCRRQPSSHGFAGSTIPGQVFVAALSAEALCLTLARTLYFSMGCPKRLLPNKPRGVLRVDDRRVLNGILWVLRSVAPWRDPPERYGPYTTCYNRFNRWRKNGVWDRLKDGIVQAYENSASAGCTTTIQAALTVVCALGRASEVDSPPCSREG